MRNMNTKDHKIDVPMITNPMVMTIRTKKKEMRRGRKGERRDRK